jgi:uncharacterized membrane protein YqhA
MSVQSETPPDQERDGRPPTRRQRDVDRSRPPVRTRRQSGDQDGDDQHPTPIAPLAGLIGRTRFVVLLAVVSVIMVSIALFVVGAGMAAQGIWHALLAVARGDLAATSITVDLLEVVSVLLKAVVFYLIGVGFYSLFIAPLNLTAALGIRSFNDLEIKVVSVVVVIMAVTYLEHFIRWEHSSSSRYTAIGRPERTSTRTPPRESAPSVSCSTRITRSVRSRPPRRSRRTGRTSQWQRPEGGRPDQLAPAASPGPKALTTRSGHPRRAARAPGRDRRRPAVIRGEDRRSVEAPPVAAGGGQSPRRTGPAAR